MSDIELENLQRKLRHNDHIFLSQKHSIESGRTHWILTVERPVSRPSKDSVFLLLLPAYVSISVFTVAAIMALNIFFVLLSILTIASGALRNNPIVLSLGISMALLTGISLLFFPKLRKYILSIPHRNGKVEYLFEGSESENLKLQFLEKINSAAKSKYSSNEHVELYDFLKNLETFKLASL